MRVTVIVPTYGNRKSIFRLLDSLKAQTYKNFDILLIYKENQGKKEILDGIRGYGKLDIEIVTQRAGRFEEALNIAYSKAEGDICINTDDDAYADRSWIRDHINMHIKHKHVGMATGMVEEVGGGNSSRIAMMLNRQKWRLNKHTVIDRPIDPKFSDYGMYIGRSGMLVDTGKRYNMIKTFKQHGVNMSWKSEALHGFRLPCYTKQGGRNEASAALEVLKRGYVPVWFENGLVHHPLQESDSRSISVATIPRELTSESVLFSYYVDHFSEYDIDLRVLRLRTDVDDLVSRIITMNRNYGYRLGYRLTKSAIEGDWRPEKVREELIRELSVGMN